MRVHCIQHSERVRPQGVERWAAERDVDLVVTRVDLEPLPAVEDVERLIVLGGEMNTDDIAQHPWLDAERAWLTQILERGSAYVFGICLGSQLLAEVLGGSCGRAAEREIGWHRMQLTRAGERSPVFGSLTPAFDAFEWHGDAWTLPPGAELLASSDGCSTQAFGWGERVHGVQFHPEFTFARMRELAATTSDDLTVGGYVQTAERFLAEPARFDVLASVLDVLLDRALNVVRTPRSTPAD